MCCFTLYTKYAFYAPKQFFQPRNAGNLLKNLCRLCIIMYSATYLYVCAMGWGFHHVVQVYILSIYIHTLTLKINICLYYSLRCLKNQVFLQIFNDYALVGDILFHLLFICFHSIVHNIYIVCIRVGLKSTNYFFWMFLKWK